MADYPQTIADYIAGLDDDDFINGGHRSNFIPTAQGTRALAYYVESTSISFTEYVDGVASQVAADAASAAAGSGTEASVANIRAVADVAHYISMRRIMAANQFVALTDAASIVWDMAAGINFVCTLGAAGRALANPTNQVAGKNGIILIKQDATGGRSITDWGNNFVWIGGKPDWPSTPNARSIISYLVEASGTILLNYGGSSL